MRFVAICVAMAGLAAAAEDNNVPPVEALISAQVNALPEPEIEAIPKGFTMAVTTSEPKAQDHVIQGLNALQGGWDFEAYRHFCAALKLDPDCLMAHWGVAMALIDPQPDLRDESTAAVARMLELIDKKAGSELERAYAAGLAAYIKDGPNRAAGIFTTASEQYPNDPQLKMMAALFSRNGYDANGKARVGQEKAEKILKDLAIADPENPVLLYGYLAVRADAPDLSGDLELARKLCQLAPNFPPFQHMLGNYEWRCGNHSRAVDAFAKSSQAYSVWMKASKLTAIDCAGWVKSECFRAVALASKGDYPTALAVAKSLAAIPIPPDEIKDKKVVSGPTSEGARMLLWEARTLPVRLLMRRSGKGDIEAAIAALPPKDSQKQYGGGSLCNFFYQGLAVALETRKATGAGDLLKAQETATALTKAGDQMQQTKTMVRPTGEGTHWLRAYEGLNAIAAEARGLISMADKTSSPAAAYGWFATAVDHQFIPSMLMPPEVLLPMKVRVAESYMAEKKYNDAIGALEEAAKAYPNDFEVLTREQQAYKEAKMADKASAVAKQLETLRSE